MRDINKARLAVLLGNFFFGTIVVAVKHISPSLIHPVSLTAVRIGVTTILFWAMFALKPERTGITKKDYPLLFFCAMAGIAVNQTFSMRGMSLTSPIHASLLVLASPIVITLLAAWLLKEKLTFNKIGGLLLGISGGALLIMSRDISTRAGDNQALGDLFIITGAVGYSFYIVCIRPLMERYKAMHILQWVFLFGAFVTVPLGWTDLKEVNWSAFDGLSWFALAYIVIGATFIAYQLMNYGISKLGAAVTGSFIYTQPFFATIASVIILHETISFSKVVAAALIMGGVFLTNLKRKEGR